MTTTDRAAWLAERSRIPGVGGSDAASLIGVGFRTADQTYREKVSPAPAAPPRGRLRRGLDLEQIVADLYAETMGATIAPRNMIDRHPDRPWQFASIDRVRGDGRPVELKTVTGFDDSWGDPGTDVVPDRYAAQAQHQLGVIGEPFADVAALDVIEWELRVYRVPFRPAVFAWLTDVEREFVEQHLIPRRPPGPDWEARFNPAGLSLLVERGRVADLGPDAADLAGRRAEFAAIASEAEEEKDRLTESLKDLMGTAETATAGAYKLKRIHTAGGPVAFDRKPSVRLDVRPLTKKGTA